MENIVDCSTTQRPCQKIEYFLNVDQGAAEGMSRLTSFDITFEKEIVTYIEEYFTYDWQSFIGEVGGTFGLFLGVSVFTTLFDLIEFFNHSLKFQ